MSSDADRWSEVQAVVDGALDLPMEERAAYVARACAGDVQLRAQATRLLAACDRASQSTGFLAGSAALFASTLVEAETQTAAAAMLLEASGGRYVVERKLARGGMATVYLARDQRHERMVAIKVLPLDTRAGLADRFLREIRTTARLNHPHLLSLHDSGEADGFLYYVMPYVDGETLRERLALAGALPVSDAVKFLRDVADALAYAHRHGLVHRDLKPENILLSGGHAIVADFGIAKALATAKQTDATLQAANADMHDAYASALMGTPAYMAPEQTAAQPGADQRADLYALGVIAFEMLSGQHPFGRLSAHEMMAAHQATEPPLIQRLRPDLPAPLLRLVMQLLAKTPQHRPQTAAEIIDQLDNLHALMDPRARASRRVRYAIAAGVLTMFVLGAGYLVRDRYVISGLQAPSSVAGSARGTGSQEAYDAYLRGRYFMQTRGLENVSSAIANFREAVRHDPQFARAHAGLAIAFVVLPIYLKGAADSAMPYVIAHAERAMALDSMIADAQLAMASALDFQVRPRDALPFYRKAVQLDPSSAEARHYLGANLLTLGETEEAITELRRGTFIDPAAKSLAGAYAFALWTAGRDQEARDAIERAIRIDTMFALNRMGLAGILVSQGHADSAVAVLETSVRVGQQPLSLLQLLYVYAAAGRWRDAARIRPQLEEPAEVAFADLVFGDPEPLIQLLATPAGQRNWQDNHFVLGCHPFLDPIRGDPRFRAAMSKLGVRACFPLHKWPIAPVGPLHANPQAHGRG